MRSRMSCAAVLALGALLPVQADDAPATIEPPAPGSVSQADGLAAFARIAEVASHPRCANCHVGKDGIPMWSGPRYDEAYGGAVAHGMNIKAGPSRIGAEALLCSTCHRADEDFSNEPHAPPRAGVAWRLPPADFQWFGKSASDICAQLADPARNGGRDWMGLAEHLVEDASHRGLVLWGWNPGGGREPAPYSLQAHVDDVLSWGTAGLPCPGP